MGLANGRQDGGGGVLLKRTRLLLRGDVGDAGEAAEDVENYRLKACVVE